MLHELELKTRESSPGDSASIETLYPAAFPGEDLLPVVRGLLTDEAKPSVVGVPTIRQP